MIRKQVYIPEDLDREITFIAKRKNQPSAALVRQYLHAGVAQEKKKKNAGDTLMEIAKLAAHGPGDLSTNFFDYAYGKKSSYARRSKR